MNGEEESGRRFCCRPVGRESTAWAELSPCQKDTLHATSRTYLDAAFKGVRKNVLEKMGLLGPPFSEAKRGKWRDLISLLSWGKKDRGGL